MLEHLRLNEFFKLILNVYDQGYHEGMLTKIRWLIKSIPLHKLYGCDSLSILGYR